MFNVDRKPQSRIYIMSNESHSVRIFDADVAWRVLYYSFFSYSFLGCIMNICISFALCAWIMAVRAAEQVFEVHTKRVRAARASQI